MNVCENCKSSLDEGATFCAQCGQKVGEQSVTPAETAGDETPKTKRSPLVPVLLVVLAVLVVAAVAVGVGFALGFFGGDDSSKADAETNASQAVTGENDESTDMSKAEAAIESGRYEEAYALLQSIDTDEADALLEKFAFVPTQT